MYVYMYTYMYTYVYIYIYIYIYIFVYNVYVYTQSAQFNKVRERLCVLYKLKIFKIEKKHSYVLSYVLTSAFFAKYLSYKIWKGVNQQIMTIMTNKN